MKRLVDPFRERALRIEPVRSVRSDPGRVPLISLHGTQAYEPEPSRPRHPERGQEIRGLLWGSQFLRKLMW